ncbi:hypothetical protein SGRA_1186 [Saprospira grandis str. Lewin]|uniref:Uncharacterized protein n=1 Tax=Saprospira grandis (strain Lewin) TaxID=984262 RepID=H6L4J7_SAPGL|nr:hypothetical protein SGRA_1186 [Saprospira grandis str. Lewin]
MEGLFLCPASQAAKQSLTRERTKTEKMAACQAKMQAKQPIWQKKGQKREKILLVQALILGQCRSMRRTTIIDYQTNKFNIYKLWVRL